MARKIADCRRWPSESNCSLTIVGEEEEVIRAAAEHAASVHGHEDTPELRDQIRDFLEPEDSYIQGAREQEPMPS
jgi:predicted small metal-binding protein